MNEKLKRILKRKKEIRAKLSANVEGTIELSDEEKNRVSHRSKALRQVLEFIKTSYKED